MKKRNRRCDPQKQACWQGVVRRWKESGQTVRDFCRVAGLRESAFFFWRRELTRRSQGPGSVSRPVPKVSLATPTAPSPKRSFSPRRRQPSFLPVRVVTSASSGAPACGSRIAAAAEAADKLEIVLAPGRVVRVPPGFDRQTLSDVLAVRVVLASRVLHTDDTPVKVRDAWQKQKYTGRFWPYVGDPRHPLVVFDYTPTQQRDGPAAFRKNYRGYLQADAFTGYDGIYLKSQGRIVEVGCWAHARRKFHECRRLDAARMETALAWIGKLYAVEKELRERCQGEGKELSLEDRATRIAAERQQRSRPLLNDFHAWLETEVHKVLPKSPVRAAMDYTLSNWAALSVYPDDGWLDIDNNEGENSLRGLCLGRRNWLFLGNDRGGRAAAVHFSLLASCKRHGHAPWVYYRDVLTRLPALLPAASEEELLALLPHRWRPA